MNDTGYVRAGNRGPTFTRDYAKKSKAGFMTLRTGWMVCYDRGDPEYMTEGGPFTSLYGAHAWLSGLLDHCGDRHDTRYKLMYMLDVRRRGCAWRDVRRELDQETTRMGYRPVSGTWPREYEQYRKPVYRNAFCHTRRPLMATHKAAGRSVCQ